MIATTSNTCFEENVLNYLLWNHVLFKKHMVVFEVPIQDHFIKLYCFNKY